MSIHLPAEILQQIAQQLNRMENNIDNLRYNVASL